MSGRKAVPDPAWPRQLAAAKTLAVVAFGQAPRPAFPKRQTRAVRTRCTVLCKKAPLEHGRPWAIAIPDRDVTGPGHDMVFETEWLCVDACIFIHASRHEGIVVTRASCSGRLMLSNLSPIVEVPAASLWAPGIRAGRAGGPRSPAADRQAAYPHAEGAM